MDLLAHPGRPGAVFEIYLVRHGQTDANERDELPSPCAQLNMEGEAQATRLAKWLGLQQKDKYSYLYTSTLPRAVQTANIVGQTLGLSPVCLDELAEMNFGKATGLNEAEFTKLFPQHAEWIADPADMTYCWPEGESRAFFKARCLRTIDGCIAKNPRKTGIIITHWCVIGFFLAVRLEGRPDNWLHYVPQFDCIDFLSQHENEEGLRWQRVTINQLY